MLNVKRRTRITVCIWIVIAVLSCLVLSPQAKAGEKEIGTKEVAVVILWYTDVGLPHNIFIVDYAHYSVRKDVIIIDRTPNQEPVDQILKGGMFDIQFFGYYQIFDYKTGTLRLDKLAFAERFRQKANEHLKLEEPKRGLQ